MHLPVEVAGGITVKHSGQLKTSSWPQGLRLRSVNDQVLFSRVFLLFNQQFEGLAGDFDQHDAFDPEMFQIHADMRQSEKKSE